MRMFPTIAVALLIGSAAITAQAANSPESWSGLVEVNARQFDSAFLLPGADFRPYTKVMLDEPQVAFRNNWLRSVNSGSASRARNRVTEADAERILATVSTNTTDIFAREFERAGFKVVTAAGPDVLRVRIGVVNLFVNAPDTLSAGRSRSFTTKRSASLYASRNIRLGLASAFLAWRSARFFSAFLSCVPSSCAE